MRILLDLQTLQSESRYRGIGQYTHGLAAALMGLGRHDWHAAFNFQMETEGLPSLGLSSDRIHCFDSLSPTRGIDPANRARMIVSERIRDAFVSTRSFDVVHTCSPFDGFGDNTVVSWPKASGALLSATVYDFIPFRMQDEYLPEPNTAEWYRRRLAGLRNADILFAISEHTRREAIEMLSISPDRIVNIGADADPVFKPTALHEGERGSLLRRYGIKRPFLINVGIPERRKNIDGLIAAWALLSTQMREQYELVLVGDITAAQRASLESLCEQSGLPKSAIRIAGFVPATDLAKLYSLARAAVMPSLAEGFGLPLLEAMRCGCPALGSNVTSIPEVVGHRDLMFDPNSPADIAERLQIVLEDDAFRRFAAGHAAAQQARFSWRRSAETMIEALENAQKATPKTDDQGCRSYHLLVPPSPRRSQSKLLSAIRDAIPSDRQVLEIDYGKWREGVVSDLKSGPLIVVAQTIHDIPADITARAPTLWLVQEAGGASTRRSLAEIYRLFGWGALVGESKNLADGNQRISADNVVGILRPRSEADGWTLFEPGREHEQHVSNAEFARAVETVWERNVAAGLVGWLPHLRQVIRETRQEPDCGAIALVLLHNHGARTRRRLYVDITHLAKYDAKSGIQRVVRNVLRELLRLRSGFRVEPIYREGETYRFARRYVGQFVDANVRLADAIVDFQPGDVFLGLDLDLTLSSEAAATLRRHRLRGVTVCFVVYDVLPLERSDWFAQGMHEMFASWLAHLGSAADGLFCISRTTAVAVEHQLRSRSVLNPETHIESFRLGADLEGDIGRDGEDVALPIECKTKGRLLFLSVATLEPRKGHRQILEAFDILWSEGEEAALVFVGRKGWNIEHLVERIRTHREFKRRLFWLDGPSDAVLKRVYQRSDAVISASEGEGFGLPLVEAAKHAKPIIARDLPVFREIAGDEAHYFTGLKGQDLAGSIREWIDLFRLGKEPRLGHGAVVSWAECTLQLLQLIEKMEPKGR